jgi:hypothetical protein
MAGLLTPQACVQTDDAPSHTQPNPSTTCVPHASCVCAHVFARTQMFLGRNVGGSPTAGCIYRSVHPYSTASIVAGDCTNGPALGQQRSGLALSTALDGVRQMAAAPDGRIFWASASSRIWSMSFSAGYASSTVEVILGNGTSSSYDDPSAALASTTEDPRGVAVWPDEVDGQLYVFFTEAATNK